MFCLGEKSREKSREKIVVIIRENPKVTQNKLAEVLQLSVKAIEKQLKSLREEGVIRRVGPDKGGHWEVIEKENEYPNS
jgi:ATP-dependent DNA helicase RecG